MRLYRKDNSVANFKVADDWEEFEDELVQTPIGERLKSEVDTLLFKEQLQAYELVQLRQRREQECFSIINQNFIIDGKSVSWFDTLTDEQKQEANIWVQSWRDVTETKIVPEKPKWL